MAVVLVIHGQSAMRHSVSSWKSFAAHHQDEFIYCLRIRSEYYEHSINHPVKYHMAGLVRHYFTMKSSLWTISSSLQRASLIKSQMRCINMNTLSNKRITRLESDIELDDREYDKFPASRLINRNPRNLEQMSFEQKPTGFWLERSAPSNWNRLVFGQDGRYLTAYLEHWSGERLVSASTEEQKLKKYYTKPKTIQAATILALVIARRCLQAGYLCAGIHEHDIDDNVGIKMKVFYDTVRSNGLSLIEPPAIVPRSSSDL